MNFKTISTDRIKYPTPTAFFSTLNEAEKLITHNKTIRPLNSFGKPGNVINLPNCKTTYIIGDLHGNIEGLRSLFKKTTISTELKNKTANLLFLGDLIHSTEDPMNQEGSVRTLLSTILLMEQFPDSIFLLRGNHETTKNTILKSGIMVSYYFNKIIKENYVEKGLSKLERFFKKLPILAVGNQFVSAHACLPSEPKTLSEIINAKEESTIYQEIISRKIYSSMLLNKAKKAMNIPKKFWFISGHHKLEPGQSYVLNPIHKDNHIILQSWDPKNISLLKMANGKPSFIKL